MMGKIVPDLDQWDYYDVNLADDMGITISTPTTTPGIAVVNDLIPYPTDLNSPEEFMEVKKIQVYHKPDAIDLIPAVSEPSFSQLDFHVGFFEFNELENSSDQYTTALKDEIKESIAHMSLRVFSPPNLTNFGGGGEYKLYDEIEFEKPVLFPLNPSLKIIQYLAVNGFSWGSEADNIFLRIWYKKTTRKLDLFGRILALFRQEVSA